MTRLYLDTCILKMYWHVVWYIFVSKEPVCFYITKWNWKNNYFQTGFLLSSSAMLDKWIVSAQIHVGDSILT